MFPFHLEGCKNILLVQFGQSEHTHWLTSNEYFLADRTHAQNIFISKRVRRNYIQNRNITSFTSVREVLACSCLHSVIKRSTLLSNQNRTHTDTHHTDTHTHTRTHTHSHTRTHAHTHIPCSSLLLLYHIDNLVFIWQQRIHSFT